MPTKNEIDSMVKDAAAKQTAPKKSSKIGTLLVLGVMAFNAVRIGIANMPHAQSQPEPAQLGYHVVSFSSPILIFEHQHMRYAAEETASNIDVAALAGKTLPDAAICPDGQESCPLRAGMTENLQQNYLLLFDGDNKKPAVATFKIVRAL
jgi:hypothetical protein